MAEEGELFFACVYVCVCMCVDYFHPQWEGGLGVPNVAWIYTSIQISHLLNMLNMFPIPELKETQGPTGHGVRTALPRIQKDTQQET